MIPGKTSMNDLKNSVIALRKLLTLLGLRSQDAWWYETRDDYIDRQLHRMTHEIHIRRTT